MSAVRLRNTALAAGAICLVLPWFVPVAPVISESYALGFSNSFFFASLVCFFIFPIYLLIRASKPVAAGSAATSAEALDGSAALLRRARIFRLIGLCTAVSLGILLVLFHRGLAHYGEAEYFLVRVRLMDIGKVPYKDFEFAYGPLLLYAITFLAKIGLSNNLALVSWVLIQTVAGYACLRYIVNSVFERGQAAGKLLFYGLFCCTSIEVILAGPQYTFTRFAMPLACSIYLLSKLRDTRLEKYSPFVALVFIPGWLISPEIGLVAGVATAAVLVMLARRKLLVSIGIAGAYALLLYIFPMILSSLRTIMEFASGGDNFPAYPGIHIIALLVAIYFSTRCIAEESASANPVAWLIYIYSLGTLRSAAGRCDPVHIIYNDFGFFILAGKYLYDRSSKTNVEYFSNYCVLTFAAFSFLLFTWAGYSEVVPIAGVITRTTRDYLSDQQKSYLLTLTPSADKEKAARILYAQTKQQVFTPESGDVLLNLKSDSIALQSGKAPFISLQHSFTERALGKAIEQIRGANRIITPYGFREEFCRPSTEDNRTLSVLLLFPTAIIPRRNDPDAVISAVCHVLNDLPVIDSGEAGGFTILGPGTSPR